MKKRAQCEAVHEALKISSSLRQSGSFFLQKPLDFAFHEMDRELPFRSMNLSPLLSKASRVPKITGGLFFVNPL
jgi:hypothetical protein